MTPFQAYVQHRLTNESSPPISFGEGSPGFDPNAECTKGGPFMNSPWCVSRVLDAFDEAVTRTENDVRKAVRAEPEKAKDPRVVAWAKMYSDWTAEKNLLAAQIQTAKDNSEWMEGEPDDADENAIGPRMRIEQWQDRTRDIRNALLDIGVPLRSAQATPEEIKKTYGDEKKSGGELAADTAKYLAIGAIAVAGAYALSQVGLFLPKQNGKK